MFLETNICSCRRVKQRKPICQHFCDIPDNDVLDTLVESFAYLTSRPLYIGCARVRSTLDSLNGETRMAKCDGLGIVHVFIQKHCCINSMTEARSFAVQAISFMNKRDEEIASELIIRSACVEIRKSLAANAIMQRMRPYRKQA